jgi:hypothetical protein
MRSRGTFQLIGMLPLSHTELINRGLGALLKRLLLNCPCENWPPNLLILN